MSHTLRDKNPELFEIYQHDVIVLNVMLSRYQQLFPDMNDLTATHALDMTEICNNLIGHEHISEYSAEELFLLMMGCYLYDIGWNANPQIVEHFRNSIRGAQKAEPITGEDELRQFIALHNRELSSFMIRKLSALFDMPTDSMADLLALICDADAERLQNPAEYPDWLGESVIHSHRLAVILYLANRISLMINVNPERTFDKVNVRVTEEVLDFAQRLAVVGLTYEGRNIVLNLTGSGTVYELIRHSAQQLDVLIERLTGSVEARIPLEKNRLVVRQIRVEGKEYAYLNADVEKRWKDKDRDAFEQFSQEEKELYLQYLGAEYNITGYLTEFSRKQGLELMSLEHRVKSPSSVYEKLHLRAAERTMGMLGDMLRYTLVLPVERYTASAQELLRGLQELGVSLQEIHNAWTHKDIPYNGMNVKLRSSAGFLVELQLHTKDSYRVKMSDEDHELYEQRRVLEPDTEAYQAILKKQFELYAGMEVPPGVERIG